MHGHWDIKESEINNPRIAQDRQRGVNLGIGIVVPAYKIHETLYQSALVNMRKEQEQVCLKQNVPGMDLAKAKQLDEPAESASRKARTESAP
jgi:hypothetical protein